MLRATSSIIAPKWKATQMSINWRVDKRGDTAGPRDAQEWMVAMPASGRGPERTQGDRRAIY